jgi:hypothetical protein
MNVGMQDAWRRSLSPIGFRRIALSSQPPPTLPLDCIDTGRPASLSMQRCPPEILDMVVRHLEHDSAALRSCSLACWSFLAPCQQLLFYAVRLQSSRRCEELLRLIIHRRELGNHIRRLGLVNDDDERRAPETQTVMQWLGTHWITLAPCIAQVTTLTVHTLDFKNIPQAEKAAFWQSCAELRRVNVLYVYMCQFEDINEVGRLLYSFPALEETDFWWNLWRAQTPPGSLKAPYFEQALTFQPTQPLRLNTVSLGTCANTEMAIWLMYTGAARFIKLLSLSLSNMELVKSSAALLRFAGSTIEQLSIDCVRFPVTLTIGVCFYALMRNLLSAGSRGGPGKPRTERCSMRPLHNCSAA